MDKTLMVAKWFCDNNNTVQTNSYDGNVLLNKLCYYAKAMFLSLNKDIIQKDVEAWKNGPVLPYVYGKYKYDDLLNSNIRMELTNDEIKVLQIINRLYGYSISKQINEGIKLSNKALLKEYKDIMLELYDNYKDEEFNEKLEIINGRYFFLAPDVTLSDDEYDELCNAKYDDENVTYYIFRDNEGNLIIY